MRCNLKSILLLAAFSVGASSCGNRVETRLAFPPAPDLQVTAEPAYPVAALELTPAGEAAEQAWWNDVLVWGRGHHDRLARVCNWARELGMELPADYCG